MKVTSEKCWNIMAAYNLADLLMLISNGWSKWKMRNIWVVRSSLVRRREMRGKYRVYFPRLWVISPLF